MAVDADPTDATLTTTDQSDGSATIPDSVEVAENANDEKKADAKPDAMAKTLRSGVGLALIIGSVFVVAVAGLVGWLGWRAYHSHQTEQQRELLVQVGRQGALNLATIDFTEVDADVKRILDSSTGTFYDDFQRRSKPFIDVVRQAQTKSLGTITGAGLESQEGDQAQVLVAVSVKTSNAGVAERAPRLWRMRISVQKVGEGAKISNVGFLS